MSDQAVDKPQNDTASKPEATGMSKSAKKRANKKQKKLSESEKTNTESERPVEVTQPETDKKKDKAEVKKPEKSNDAVDKLVPLIQRFDVNGKPLRTIAGNIPVHLGEITPHNILQLKKLNEAVFPIAYNDKFYVEARTCGDLGRLAYYNDVVVGAVCCRIDDISDEKSLYLMTLGTLAAYRQCGIGTILINYALKLCKKLEEVKTMYLHVQVNNEKAVSFYEKHGFVNDGIIEDYYRISPRDAYLLIKRIRN
ncbi:hypothetical protein L5515_017468 [Caenorhabditis briggsae]|nr:hypothetical protein L5515_017468 [Caenorhabditis briggsae]